MQNAKSKILKALFAEAKRLGISQEMVRETIAQAVIGKRLSAAKPQEIARVIDYITGRHNTSDTRHSSLATFKRYESSRAGLLQEIKDLAIARFGQDFIRPLNALCERFKVEGYRSLRVNQAKAVKATLIRLQAEDPRNLPGNPPPTPASGGQFSPFGGGNGGGEKVIEFRKGTKGVLNQLGEMDKISEQIKAELDKNGLDGLGGIDGDR